MKTRLLLLLLSFTVLLSSCFDTVEEITIAQNGSGTYRATLDLSNMYDMVGMLASQAGETGVDAKLFETNGRVVDTVMKFSAFPQFDTISADQKALWKDAELRMLMNPDERKWTMGITIPYTSAAHLQTTLTKGTGAQGLSSIGALIGKGGEDNGEAPTDEAGTFDWKVSPGLLSRTVKAEAVQKLKSKMEDTEEGEKMKEMFGVMHYKTVVRLPSPAKTVVGKSAVLSDDKKTVTVAYSMSDLLDNPEAVAFRIEY